MKILLVILFVVFPCFVLGQTKVIPCDQQGQCADVDATGALKTVGGASSDPSYTDAPGTTHPANVAAVGGSDGTNTTRIKTDAAGELQVDILSGTVTSNQGTAAAGSGAWPITITTTGDAVVKAGDSVNNAMRVNVVASSAAGTASYEQPGGADQAAELTDADTGAGTEWLPGIILKESAATDAVAIGVTANPLSISITNTADAEVKPGDAVNNAMRVNCVTGCVAGGSFTDNSAFTPGTTSVTIIAGEVDDVTPGLVTEGNAGAPRMDTNRSMYVQLRSGTTEAGTSGVPLRVDPTGTTTQPVSGTVTANGGTSPSLANAWNIKITDGVDTATVTAGGLLQVDGSGVTQPVSGTVTANAGTGNFNVVGTKSNNGGVPGATNLGTLPGVATAAAPTYTEGNQVSVSTDLSGSTRTNVTNTVTVTDGAGAMNVIVDSGTITVGTFPDNEPFNVAQVGGVAVTADNATAGTTNIHTLPAVVETSTTLPARTDGNRAALIVDSDGRAFTRPFDVDPLNATSGLSTATVLTQLIAAPGASVSVYIHSISCSASVASTTTADQQCRIKAGTGAACATGTTDLWGAFQPANGGAAVTFPSPIKVTANNAVCWIHAVVGSKIVNIQYHLAP